MQYSLRRLWPHDEEFAWCVEYIRRVGYQERFIGRVWTYLDAGPTSVPGRWESGA